MKIKTPLGILLATSIAMTGCSNNNPAVNADVDTGDVTTLRFSHFMTANDNINTEALQPWAKKIEEESKGRLKIEIYPSATLSKPGATYPMMLPRKVLLILVCKRKDIQQGDFL